MGEKEKQKARKRLANALSGKKSSMDYQPVETGLELSLEEKIKLLPQILQKSRSPQELEIAGDLLNGKTIVEILKDRQLTKVTLYDYLSRGPFAERLQKFRDAGAADLFATAYVMAREGNERMMEMVLPALSEDLDSGIRRERARAKGEAANRVLAKLLEEKSDEPS